MKRIFKSTIIFAVCLTLAACGTGSPRDITVQSITEPIVTQQTVNVPEVTEVAENTVGTVLVENWEEPVATELDDPGAGIETEAYTGVTLPDAVDADIASSVIVELFQKGLLEASTDYEAGENSYDECNECYKKLLVEKLYSGRGEFCEFFGGAYFDDGNLFLRITDTDKREELFSDCFDGLAIEVISCKYSYMDLWEIHYIAEQNENVNWHLIDAHKNCVELYGEFTDEDKENITAEIEAAGYASDAVEFIFRENVSTANPC